MTSTAPRSTNITGVIVLDLDDTLYLERDYVFSGFAAVGDWLNTHRHIPGFASVAAELFASGRRGDIFNAALVRLGIDPAPDLISQLVAIYRDHYPDIRLLPDAARFLDHGSGHYAHAMLTDGHLNSQQNKIRALGLGQRNISPIVCTGLWGRDYWKPHRRGFQHIASHHALPSAAFIYIADNPAKDFIAPRALGWKTVQIVRPDAIHPSFNPDPADITINSLDELTDDRLEALFHAR